MITGPRIGAYVLAADPTWIRSSVRRYYHLLDALVVSVPRDGRGWTGAPVQSEKCLKILQEIDTRGIGKVCLGSWISQQNPLDADTRQRNDAIKELARMGVDWILQIDTDEVLPSPEELMKVISIASDQGIGSVEWPMRVLFRRTIGGRYLEIVASDSLPRYDYPGPIAVRADEQLVDCRRTAGAFLRPVIHGDNRSLQVVRPEADNEIRMSLLDENDAIWHNSWARSRKSVRRKVASWGHNEGLRTRLYYWMFWLPSIFTWPVLRDIHPFARGLWPRLARASRSIDALIDPVER